MTDSIDIKTLKKLLLSKETVTLIDVRRKADYEADPQKITGATWHDPEEMDAWIKQLPADKRIVAYCVKGGLVSQSVTDRLRQEGLDTLFLERGLKDWVDKG